MALTTGEPEGKEATILGLAIETEEMLDRLQAKLASFFSRVDKGVSEKGDLPELSNILDEVIKRLEGNKLHLFNLTTFISSEVLAKIKN